MEHINETDEPVTWRDLKNYFVWRAAEARVIRYREYVRWSTAAFVLAVSLVWPSDVLMRCGTLAQCIPASTWRQSLRLSTNRSKYIDSI